MWHRAGLGRRTNRRISSPTSRREGWRSTVAFLWIVTLGVSHSIQVEIRPTPYGGTPATATPSTEAEPEFLGPIANVTVAVGREAILSCSVANIGNYRVAWIKHDDQTILTIHSRVVTHNPRVSVAQDGVGTWQLRIRQVKESDKSCYMCQINTSVMKKQFGCVDVLVPPDISDGLTSGDVTEQEGDNTTLVCSATGRPRPRIVWRREDGDHIILKKGHRDIIKADTFAGENLTLVKLERRQMGAYLCIASNDVPPAVSKRITLNINFAPVIKTPNQLQGAPLGTDVQLECYVEAFPNTINYWVKNRGDMLLTGRKHMINEEKIGPYKVHLQLTIMNFSKRDLGTYMCVATNSLGRADGTIRLYEIKVPTKPPTTTTTTEAYSTTISTTVSTQLTIARRKIHTTTHPASYEQPTPLHPVEDNLIIPSDRSAPNDFYHASSGGSSRYATTATTGVVALVSFLLSPVESFFR